MTEAVLRFPSRTFASLRKYRNYRLFFSGQVISVTGTWMQRVAQAWLVLSLTHSPVAVGILALCQFMPFTVFSLVAGVIVDRLDAWRTVIGTQTVQMFLAGSIAVVALAGVAQPWHVYVIAAAMGVVQVLDAPSRQSLTYRMVGPDELQNAISLNSGLFNGARIFGPALGGVVIAAAGAGFCFALNAVSYIAVLAGLLLMRVGDFHPVERRERPPLLNGLREGFRFARQDRRVVSVLVLVFVLSTFCLNFNVLLPVLAKQTLDAGPRTFGLLSGTFGAGALLGALVAANLSGARMRNSVVGGAGFAACELLLAPVQTVWLASLLLFLAGICFSTWSSSSNSIVQLAAPDHLRGRVIGLYFFAFAGTGTAGGILAGSLTAAGGTELAFSVAGCVGLVASLLTGLQFAARGRPRAAEPALADDRLAA